MSDKLKDNNEKSNGKSRVDFSKFFVDPKGFFEQNSSLPENKLIALLGLCVREKSLRHAILLLSRFVIQDYFKELKVEIKNVYLTILCLDKHEKGCFAGKKLTDFLLKEDDQQNPLFRLDVMEFVSKLLESSDNGAESDESMFTLAIRFYCRHGETAKAQELFSRTTKSGVKPHNRTFIPLIQTCTELSQLVAWHITANKAQTPSIEFYECYFEKLLSFLTCVENSQTENAKQVFVKEFNLYRQHYCYLTPTLKKIFVRHLRYRADIRVNSDGLIYAKGEMPFHKLGVYDLSYSDKLAYAMLLKNYRENDDDENYEDSLREGRYLAVLDDFEKHFQDHNVTWDVVIDGANVALYNNNPEFGYDLIVEVAKYFITRDKKVLIILHQSRDPYLQYRNLETPARDPSRRVNLEVPPNCRFRDSYGQKSQIVRDYQNFLSKNKKTVHVVYTPVHYNDDIFWLYAALTRDTDVVTNDMMDDHVFRLHSSNTSNLNKRPDMKVWRERHQIQFAFNHYNLTIKPPAKYSKMICLDETRELIHAPIYDPVINSEHYVENQHLVSEWCSFDYSENFLGKKFNQKPA
jgi:hypothetical protein